MPAPTLALGHCECQKSPATEPELSTEAPAPADPPADEAAAFVTELLGRYDQLVKEILAIRDGIASAWSPDHVAHAREERHEQEERLEQLLDRSVAGDAAAG